MNSLDSELRMVVFKYKAIIRIQIVIIQLSSSMLTTVKTFNSTQANQATSRSYPPTTMSINSSRWTPTSTTSSESTPCNSITIPSNSHLPRRTFGLMPVPTILKLINQEVKFINLGCKCSWCSKIRLTMSSISTLTALKRDKVNTTQEVITQFSITTLQLS